MPQPLHILLVDDDEDDIAFFQLALKRQTNPPQLTTLLDGDHVLSHLETTTERPDLLILDLNLPRMHGRDVLVQLQNSPIGLSIPVVMLTTSSAQEDRDFCLNHGAAAFLTKPTSLATLSINACTDVMSTGESVGYDGRPLPEVTTNGSGRPS